MTKVTSFVMHDGVFVPGIGSRIDATVTPDKYRGIKMELKGPGIECLYKGKRFVIPAVNCKVINLDSEDIEEKPKAK